MERGGQPHWDVAAYALGVLEPREIPRYEQHLAGCPSCALELERLLPASAVLADVDPAELREVDDFRQADRLLEAVRGQRHRDRRRQRLAVVAGTAVAAAVAGLALLAGASWFGGPGAGSVSAVPSPSAAAPAGIGGPELGDGQRFSATDPTTGVHADVLLKAADWGTQVSFALSALAGPRECQLVVVRTDGTPEATASWRVPADGYGTAAQPAPLTLQTATAVPRTDIDQIEVRAFEPDGTFITLVTVPL